MKNTRLNINKYLFFVNLFIRDFLFFISQKLKIKLKTQFFKKKFKFVYLQQKNSKFCL